MLSCVTTEDLENRFRFSDSLPPPEKWTHGPKIYPSKSKDAGTSQYASDQWKCVLALFCILAVHAW